MTGYIKNIEQETLANNNFRKVLFTGQNAQLVVMSLKPNEAIGVEIHADTDQFLRLESGEGKAILDGKETVIKENDAVFVPAGTEHNIINTSANKMLKLYTIYSPPHHRDGTIHAAKTDAMNDGKDHY